MKTKYRDCFDGLRYSKQQQESTNLNSLGIVLIYLLDGLRSHVFATNRFD